MSEFEQASDPRAWRQVCREAAHAQSLQEARAAWGVSGDAPVPFNYRWEHVTQVVSLAKRLARATQADLEIVEAAAWLHDVRKEESSHAKAGAQAAREILAATDFPPEKIEAVAYAIRQHAGLTRRNGAPPLEPIEAAVLWDADKLTKIGVQALMVRWSSADTRYLTMAERWRDSAKFAHNTLPRTVASMNTGPAKVMADRRLRNMLAVLSLWMREARENGMDLRGDEKFEVSFDYPGVPQE